MAPERQQHGQPQPVADHLGDRAAVFEGAAEIAAHHHREPFPVLHVERLVQAVGWRIASASAAEIARARRGDLRGVGGRRNPPAAAAG